MNEQELLQLQKKLGYLFKNTSLLITALTHSSYANENKSSGATSNERMEFLGDSVLGMSVSKLLFESKAQMPEGTMTKLRAELVCERSLASLARNFNLGNYIILGRGEAKGGGNKRASILADTMEAIIAAIYLDGGFDAALGFIKDNLIGHIDLQKRENTDYKTVLQEQIQVKTGQVLAYNVIDESGPDHDKVFYIEVLLNGNQIGQGSGKSKKEAEQAAAKSALDKAL